MRDYSFGNFISTLRERRGLSQYQLGALVGVSDKAVSKWENGASKPRMDTVRKLAEVLDVSIDELLSCEYSTVTKRKDLFAMKNRVLGTAWKKMKKLYGDNPPIRIMNRFQQEELISNERDMLLWIGFFGKLHEKCKEENAYFEIHIGQMKASFITWLVSESNVNPLPAHYYCPACKKVEFVTEAKCGLDLPEKTCTCGKPFKRDGFNIDLINVYPLLKWNHVYVSNKATALVKDCLHEYFDGYGEIREIRWDNTVVSEISETLVTTEYGIFPKEISSEFPDGVITLKWEEHYDILDKIFVLTVNENKYEHLCTNDVINTEFTTQQIKAYHEYAVKTGVYNGNNEDIHLDKILSDFENPSFSDLLILYGFLCSVGAWKENAELLYDEGIPLNEMIFCREDVYSYLYEKLNGKCCEDPSGQVYEIKENLRKGKYAFGRMPAETERLLLECDVPEWYVESMKKILYLTTKTHLIGTLKRDICKFVKIQRIPHGG